MNERPAKIAVICHMLFTLASLLLAIYFFLFVPGKGIVPMVGLPIWMGYSVYATIKSVADIIGRQRRFTNFSNMIARWEDTLEGRGKALALLTFMTVIVGAVKIAVPLLLMELCSPSPTSAAAPAGA